MPQAQQNLSLTAPAFQGVNTEDSPLAQDITFADTADNAVIDSFGRLGSRRGFKNFVTNYDWSDITPPAHDNFDVTVGAIHHSDGFYPVCVLKVDWKTGANVTATTYELAVVVTASNTIVAIGGVAANVTADSMRGKFVTYGNRYYLFSDANSTLEINSQGVSALVLKDSAGFIPPQDDGGNLTGGDIIGDVVCSAYGRLWVSGVGGDTQTIYYSSLESPLWWYDGKAVPTESQNTGGIINVSQYWPNGRDDIQAIVAHNNMLVVFGRSSILLYGNPVGDPAAIGGIFLQDTIDGIGLVSRDAVCSTGNDVLFVDDTGVRSLGRSIQEQSVPLGDLTANVRTDISSQIANTLDKADISLSYWPDEALVVCNFAGQNKSYVLDQRRASSTGGARITTWSDVPFDRSIHVAEDDRVLMGSARGDAVYTYEGGYDFVDTSFKFSYKSNPLTFGDSVRQKFPKRMDITVISKDQPTTATARWGFGDVLEYSRQLTIAALFPDYWGVARYGQASYGPGRESVRRYRVNTKGSGALVVLGIEAEMDGGVFSIQELNIQTLLGRIY